MGSAQAARTPFRTPLARIVLLLVALALAASAGACGGGADAPRSSSAGLAESPGPPEGIRVIAEAFTQPGSDPIALAASLKPTEIDYPEVFRLDVAADARKHYDGYWATPRLVPPASGQTEFRIDSVTTDELLAGTGAASAFPSGYRTAARELAPGLTVYQITFHRPGDTIGVIMDGFVFVNDRWRIMPAPWAVLSVNEPGHQH